MNIYNYDLNLTGFGYEGEGDDEGGEDAASAAAKAGEQQGDDAKPSPFRQGVEKAAGQLDDDGVRFEQTPDDDAGDDEGEDTDKGDDDKSKKPDAKAGDKDGKKSDDGDEGDATDDEEADAAFQQKVDQEVADLKLSGKTETRFREMSGRIRELETKHAEFAEIEKVLPGLQAAADAAAKWEDTLASTGATEEQFARTMSYLYAIHHGTREEKQQALTALDGERAWLAKELGVKSDTYNPLDEHADLKKRVESGDLDEADALDIVEARRVKKERDEASKNDDEASKRVAAEKAALAEVAAFDKEMKADPQYAYKLRTITPTIQLVRRTLPPAQWKAEIKKAWDAVVVPKLEKRTPTPIANKSSIRPGASNGQVGKPTSKDAFRVGVQRAKEHGR